MFSVLKEIRWILFGLLLLGLAMIFTMRAMAGSPVGWHEDVWPATNAAPYQPMQKIDYGLYGQQTNCVYTNWFWLGTNWFQVTTNGVTNFLSTTTLTNNNTPFCHHVPTGEPTNATYGVELTNWIGVSIIVPTNYCYADLHDLRPPFSQLVNVTPSGGTVFNSNTWTRDVLISGDTDEDFRWAWLRGADQTNIVGGVTNIVYWYEREIAPAVNPSKTLGYPFPLYYWALLNGGGTNWYATSNALVSGTWSNSTGSSQQWQYVYAPMTEQTNIVAGVTNVTHNYLGVEDTEAMDCVLALDERRMVVPGITALPKRGLGFGVSSNADMLAAIKLEVLALAPSFVVKELADTNGDFTAYLAKPLTNWVWTIGQQLYDRTWQVNIRTNWVPAITHAADLPHWTAVKTQACTRLNLPIGWVTRTGIVATNVTAGWITGDYTTQWITNYNVSVTYSNSYGGYFDYTPRKRFTTGYPGSGHIVTSHWDFADLWTAVPKTIITNQLVLPCNTGIVEPLGYTETQSVFSVLAPTKTAVVTNCVAGTTTTIYCATSGLTNGVLGTNVTENTLTVYLRGLTKTNGLVSASNDFAFSTIVFSNAWSGSTSNCVLTNYDVAAGWHEIDYGWDGVRTFLDDLTWQDLPLTPYPSNFVQTGRWEVADTVSTNDLGIITVRATTPEYGFWFLGSDGGRYFGNYLWYFFNTASLLGSGDNGSAKINGTTFGVFPRAGGVIGSDLEDVEADIVLTNNASCSNQFLISSPPVYTISNTVNQPTVSTVDTYSATSYLSTWPVAERFLCLSSVPIYYTSPREIIEWTTSWAWEGGGWSSGQGYGGDLPAGSNTSYSATTNSAGTKRFFPGITPQGSTKTASYFIKVSGCGCYVQGAYCTITNVSFITTRTITYDYPTEELFTSWAVVQLYAPLDSVPTNSVSVALRTSKTSSALIYPEAFTNSSATELYVRTAKPTPPYSTINWYTTPSYGVSPYNSWWAQSSYWLPVDPTVPLGVIATNIEKAVFADATCPPEYVYAYAGNSAYYSGVKEAILDFHSSLPCFGSGLLRTNVDLGDEFTAANSIDYVFLFESPPCVANYVGDFEGTPGQVLYTSQLPYSHAYPTPSIEKLWLPGSDARTVVTNYNVQNYAMGPVWDSEGHGLNYDQTNNLGLWQRVPGGLIPSASDITFTNFVDADLPWVGNTEYGIAHSWGIDNAKALIKWDSGTNGFRYHKRP